VDVPPDGDGQAEAVIDGLSATNVLVTGGCGFIGLNLVERLLAEGAAVTVVDLPDASWPHLPAGARQVKADLLDPASLRGACDGAEIVYHLAARTDIDGETLEDYALNYTGTANLIDECARAAGVRRLVFYSTQLVVGLFNETRFIDETEPYRTKTAYGASKIEGERAVADGCAAVGIRYTVIRPTSVYGPWGETPYREFFQAIKRRRYFHVGPAGNLVSWVYVKNLVELTLLASVSPAAEDQTYFGNDFHPYTMREIVDTVGDYYGIRVPTAPSAAVTALAYALALPKRWGLNVPIYPFRLHNIRANYCYDVGKSIAMGFRPRYDLADGVRETLDWYEARGLL
jgi:nucleoside-diphosphate-sugar epimerase